MYVTRNYLSFCTLGIVQAVVVTAWPGFPLAALFMKRFQSTSLSQCAGLLIGYTLKPENSTGRIVPLFCK